MTGEQAGITITPRRSSPTMRRATTASPARGSAGQLSVLRSRHRPRTFRSARSVARATHAPRDPGLWSPLPLPCRSEPGSRGARRLRVPLRHARRAHRARRRMVRADQERPRRVRFRIEARWQKGDLPNWWSRVGFIILSGYYQRKWHRRAHQRLSLLAHHGSAQRPRRDWTGLTHQEIDVRCTYHTKRTWFQ